MITLIKDRLLISDFASCLNLLQHYPNENSLIDILKEANKLQLMLPDLPPAQKNSSFLPSSPNLERIKPQDKPGSATLDQINKVGLSKSKVKPQAVIFMSKDQLSIERRKSRSSSIGEIATKSLDSLKNAFGSIQ